MARPTFRFPFLDFGAFLGVLLGCWLIQQTFQPASDLPNRALFALAVFDLLVCFSLLGYRLRRRLQAGDGLPSYWIVTGAVSLACYLGWIAALLLDANRVASEQKHHRDYDQQVAKLIESLSHLGDAVPANQAAADKNIWQVNYDCYNRLHDQLQTALHANAGWEKDLTQANDQVNAMHKLFLLYSAEPNAGQRVKWRGDFQIAYGAAMQKTGSLRSDIAQSGGDLANIYRVRWQALGAAALTGAVLILGALLMWIVFDRELRRVWKRHARLALDETRYRSLVEKNGDALTVLDAAGNIAYVNPAWQSAFGYEADDLLGRHWYDLIHADDRERVRASPAQTPITCRLSADYGVWHDVELLRQPTADDGTTIVRVRDLRETAEMPKPAPKPPSLDPRLQQQQDRIAELEREIARLRVRETAQKAEIVVHLREKSTHSV